ncbi:MAG: archease [Thermogemmata sp.]|nr:archease [Gemmataceae bacterium]GIW84700.1 MAG: archease [Gemmataceae bacterium]
MRFLLEGQKGDFQTGMYELFEHTADLGLRIRAADLNTLFAEAATALFATLLEDITSVRPQTAQIFRIEGEDRELLLFDWLRTLLLTFDEQHWVFSRFDVQVHSQGLQATAWGEPFDPQRHLPGHEVKAITYHGLKVEQLPDGTFLAEVIVDI